MKLKKLVNLNDYIDVLNKPIYENDSDAIQNAKIYYQSCLNESILFFLLLTFLNIFQ